MTGAPARPLARCSAAWNRFFHAPLDLRVCAFVRIAYAVLVLIWLAILLPHLTQWYGNDGLLPLVAARKVLPPYQWSLLEWLPQDDFALYAAYTAAIVQTLLLLVGCFSRLNAACVFVWVFSFANRNYLILDSEDAAFRLVGFFLILMPCGACWSVDSWLRTRGGLPAGPGHVASPPRGPAWGLRLLQIQMCVIFLSAGLSKLEAPQWRDGTAMYYVSRLDDYFGRFPTPDFLWQTPWIVRGMTWGVIAIELVIPVVIWWRPARRWALAALLAFHMANEYAMYLFLFHWIMLVGWSAFLTGDDVDLVSRFLGRRRLAPAD